MTNKFSLNAAILRLGILLVCRRCSAFSTHHSRAISTTDSEVQLWASRDDSKTAFVGSRRSAISSVVTLGSIAIMLGASSEGALATDASESTIWKTGRAPIVPGQKPKEKGDTKGTRKDPSFLRSVSDCRAKCETTPGFAKTSAECLAECQDISCTTYEQCTFAIVPR